MARPRKSFSVVPAPDLVSAKGLERISLFNPDGSSYSSGSQVFEVENLVIPSGTDWSGTGHKLTDIVYDTELLWFLNGLFYLELDAPLDATGAGTFQIGLSLVSNPDDAYNTNDFGVWLTATAGAGSGDPAAFYRLPDTTANIGQSVTFQGYTPHASGALSIVTSGPTPQPITVVQARAAFEIVAP